MLARTHRATSTIIDVPPTPSLSQQLGHQESLPAILYRRRWTVVAALLLCLAAAFAYVARATPIYSSSSRIYIEQQGARILSDSAIARQSDTFIYTQAEILKSAPILAAAVKQAQIQPLKSFDGADNPVALLQKSGRFSVSVGKKDDIVTVSFLSPYPEEAAHVVNEVVEAYIAYSAALQKSTAAEMLKVLQRERTDREAELERRFQEVTEFKQKNGAISFTNRDRSNIVLERLATLSSTLTTVEMEMLEAKTKRNLISSLLGDPQLVSAYVQSEEAEKPGSDQDYQALQTELRSYKMARANRGVVLGVEARSTKVVEAGIATLEQELKAKEMSMAKALLTQAEVTLASLEARSQEIHASFERQQKDALSLNATAAELLRLEANVERTQKQCDLLDARIKEINVNSSDAGTLNVQVLEVARPERNPTSPKRSQAMAMALILGLLVGSGAAFVQDLLDQRIRNPEEIAGVLGLSVLGIVPHIKGDSRTDGFGRYIQSFGSSEVAEAFRTVRTALFFGAKGAKTFMVTSPAPGDGKSTTASNLAIAMAQAGHRTLLMDCDLRKPTQHKIHELDPNLGLTQVIEGHAKLKSVIAKTSIDRLYVLPCGPIPTNPAEMLTGRRFEQVLKAIIGAYDRIVLDSPPLNAVSDAQVLTGSVDATVLVLRIGRSTRRGCRLAVNALQATGASIAGVVVNDVPKNRGTYGYYYNGYYGAGPPSSATSPSRNDPSAQVDSDAVNLNGESISLLTDESISVGPKKV